MEQVEIDFADASAADATRLADDLATFLKTQVEGAGAEVTRGSVATMDLGATVALVFGTPAVAALVRGLADWIRRQGDPELVIKTKKGSVTVKAGLDLATKKEVILAALEKGVV